MATIDNDALEGVLLGVMEHIERCAALGSASDRLAYIQQSQLLASMPPQQLQLGQQLQVPESSTVADNTTALVNANNFTDVVKLKLPSEKYSKFLDILEGIDVDPPEVSMERARLLFGDEHECLLSEFSTFFDDNAIGEATELEKEATASKDESPRSKMNSQAIRAQLFFLVKTLFAYLEKVDSKLLARAKEVSK